MRSWRMIGPIALALCLLPILVPLDVSAAPSGAAQTPARPELRSNAFYILDEADSSVLAARHERMPMPIASITKLMTALVVLEAGQKDDEIIAITSDDVRGTAGSRSRLAPGARLTRGDLLHLALMSSENRAAHALCRSYPGGKAACVQAMNHKAQALGMSTARFVEPTGLSSSNVASPEDLAKLVLAAAGNSTIREFSTDAAHTVLVNRKRLDFRNTNRLVANPGWQVSVQKTGYISEAGRCLVMQTVIDGRQVVIVLLNSWGKLTRIADAQRVRRWVESTHRSEARASKPSLPSG
jgi:D-alanyl-D-alanine endopeptidase (penicillin-binding protein 7)